MQPYKSYIGHALQLTVGTDVAFYRFLQSALITGTVTAGIRTLNLLTVTQGG